MSRHAAALLSSVVYRPVFACLSVCLYLKRDVIIIIIIIIIILLAQ